MTFPPEDHECKPREPWELGWYSKRYVDGTNIAFGGMSLEAISRAIAESSRTPHAVRFHTVSQKDDEK
jgi:hypothetical protein